MVMSDDPIKDAIVKLSDVNSMPLEGKLIEARISYLEQRLKDVWELTEMWINKEEVPNDFRAYLLDEYGIEIYD
jgi:hypothetical protein